LPHPLLSDGIESSKRDRKKRNPMTSHTTPSVSRRTALAGLGAGALGLALAARGLAVSAQDATPFPMADHPLVGVWQMANLGVWSFGGNGNFGLFEPTGGGRFCVGEWRATGGRSADLAFVLQGVERKDLFDPAQAAEQFELGRRFELWRLAITVDGTDDAMTIVGQWESYMGGPPQPGNQEHETGVRMAPVSTA
jgi:hypothetical protein